MIEAQHHTDLSQLFDQTIRRAEGQHFPAPTVESQGAIVTPVVVNVPVLFLPTSVFMHSDPTGGNQTQERPIVNIDLQACQSFCRLILP